MPAMALAPRPQSAELLLTAVLTLFGFPAAAQQLGTTFALAEQQTAVAHVVPGQFLRVRLKDGSRTGGPLIQATPVAFTLGPSVAFGDDDSRLYLGTVDSMWVRVSSTRRGTVVGALIGAAAGLAVGVSAASLCPTEAWSTKPCAQGAMTSVAGGLLVGGFAGSLFGSGQSHWRRLLPRDGTGTAAPTGTMAVLILPDDSTAFDARSLVLMRVSRDHLLRLAFGDRGDLGGYVVRAGAHGATLDVVSGHPGDTPISIRSLEGIWELGTAARQGSTIGLLAGSAVSALVTAHSRTCDRTRCIGNIFANGVLGGIAGYFLGKGVGRWFAQWQRKY